MENATFTAADIAEIEAEAHALRAEATFNTVANAHRSFSVGPDSFCCTVYSTKDQN